MSFLLSLLRSWERARGLAGEIAAQCRQPAGDASVDDLVADLDLETTRERGVDLDVQGDRADLSLDEGVDQRDLAVDGTGGVRQQELELVRTRHDAAEPEQLVLHRVELTVALGAHQQRGAGERLDAVDQLTRAGPARGH